MEEIKNKMRRAAINNYENPREVYAKDSIAERDAIVYFKKHLSKIENGHGDWYFTYDEKIGKIPHWAKVEEEDEEIGLLQAIIDDLIPLAKLIRPNEAFFHVRIPSDSRIRRKIHCLEYEIEEKTQLLKRLKME